MAANMRTVETEPVNNDRVNPLTPNREDDADGEDDAFGHSVCGAHLLPPERQCFTYTQRWRARLERSPSGMNQNSFPSHVFL